MLPWKIDGLLNKVHRRTSCKWCCIFCIIIYLNVLLFKETVKGLKWTQNNEIIPKLLQTYHLSNQPCLIFQFYQFSHKTINGEEIYKGFLIFSLGLESQEEIWCSHILCPLLIALIFKRKYPNSQKVIEFLKILYFSKSKNFSKFELRG